MSDELEEAVGQADVISCATLAINDGSTQASDIKGELRDLVTGAVGGRKSDESITLLKSVGTAIEDPAAAELAIKNRG